MLQRSISVYSNKTSFLLTFILSLHQRFKAISPKTYTLICGLHAFCPIAIRTCLHFQHSHASTHNKIPSCSHSYSSFIINASSYQSKDLHTNQRTPHFLSDPDPYFPVLSTLGRLSGASNSSTLSHSFSIQNLMLSSTQPSSSKSSSLNTILKVSVSCPFSLRPVIQSPHPSQSPKAKSGRQPPPYSTTRFLHPFRPSPVPTTTKHIIISRASPAMIFSLPSSAKSSAHSPNGTTVSNY